MLQRASNPIAVHHAPEGLQPRPPYPRRAVTSARARATMTAPAASAASSPSQLAGSRCWGYCGARGGGLSSLAGVREACAAWLAPRRAFPFGIAAPSPPVSVAWFQLRSAHAAHALMSVGRRWQRQSVTKSVTAVADLLAAVTDLLTAVADLLTAVNRILSIDTPFLHLT